MCERHAGNFFEPPSFEVCDAVTERAERDALRSGHIWDDLTDEQRDEYLEDASLKIHPAAAGRHSDDDDTLWD